MDMFGGFCNFRLGSLGCWGLGFRVLGLRVILRLRREAIGAQSCHAAEDRKISDPRQRHWHT